ncbi:putative ribonuclease H-like domain-containing protein, partial [Tanacetum coccineum]
RTRIVEENLHVKFSEETPNIAGNGPNWLFDIDALTKSMNYKQVVAGNQTNGNAGTNENIDTGQARKKIVPDQEYILLPLLTSDPSLSKNLKDSPDAGFKPSGKEEKMDAKHPKNKDNEVPNTEEPRVNQEQDESINSTNNINTVSSTVNAASIQDNVVFENIVYGCKDDPNMPNLEEIVYSDDDEEVGAEADMNNLATTVLRTIGTKWVYRNKKDDRGIVVRNKERLVAQGYTQEEGIDYDEVFAPFARIEAIRLFLAYVSFMNFIVYQMDVKSAFLYGSIEEEVYVCQPPGFKDPKFPNKVYKVEKALYGLHQAPRAWYETLSTYLLENRFRRGTIDKTLFIKKDKGDILFVQVSSMGELTFFLGLQACTRFQVTPKTSLLHDVKRIFRYLKGLSKLGLWYPRDSPFDLEAFSDSDYAGTSLDRKSITGGCQFLGRRLISWQCKKQTIVANSTTEVEYVAAANCCGQVLWIQNQLLDYGYNFMNTKIFIDNESTICIVKNPVFHSKTKHIEIRHHFIRDSYEKKLIQVIKIHTDHNVADLLTKEFDSSGPIPLVSDKTVIKEWEDRMERAATTASSLEAEQDSGNINRTQSIATLNKSFPQGTDSGSGLRFNTLGSREENMKLKELMEFCTKLSERAFDL